MPDLDQLFQANRNNRPDAFAGAHCFEADVIAVTSRGVYVTIPGYDRNLRWGPCMPEGAVAEVGDRVAVVMSNLGRPWLLSLPPYRWRDLHAEPSDG